MKRLLTNFLLLSILISGIETLNAQTTVPALITSNQVWDMSGSPYLINQNTYVDSGVKVMVKPGVEVLGLNGNIQLIIDGELQAIGTLDSAILFDQLQIEFRQKARAYDSATGTGAYFNHCVFTSPGSGKMVIYVMGPSIKIQNSTFSNTYYSLYIIGILPSQRVDLLSCTFEDTTGTSTPIYSGGNNVYFYLAGNTFTSSRGGGSIYIYGRYITMLDNTFNGMFKIAINTSGSLISCNLFKNLKQGVEVNISAMDTVNSHVFTHNTLDSIGYSFGADPMLKVSRNSPNYKLNQSRFNNNNFLHHIGTGRKVIIYGSNTTPTSFESVDLKHNYWLSTDSTTIDTGMIWDYSDDIKMFGRANFSGFLSNLDSTCGDTVGSSCHASYYLAVDTASPFNLFVINTSTGTSSNTTYTWDFGDGYTSNDPSPSHTYGDYGKYYLCVTLYNAAENCSSTYCDSIGLDSSGMLLKNGAFTIHVINEDELSSIGQQDFFGDIHIYPNPTGGKVIIETGELNNEPMTIRVFDLSGKTLYDTRNDGAHHFELDLSGFPEGLYLLNLQKGQSMYTTKIVVNR
ncbi:MAG: T9SS type A sorting domain-containing protein [Bacteroidia bacterium]